MRVIEVKELPALVGQELGVSDWITVDQKLIDRFADLTDGTAHTLLVAEKRMNLRFLGQPQDDDNEGYTAGWNEDTIRRTTRPPAPDHRDPTGDGDKLFGSSHPGRMNAAFADGSVRPVSYAVDRLTFELLGDRADGLPIPGDY